MRDENGLALSSRNAYLTQEQYKIAIILNTTLYHMARSIGEGMDISTAEETGRQMLLNAGFDAVDYITPRHAQTLLAPEKGDKDLRLLAAAHVGRARLIDNIPLSL